MTLDNLKTKVSGTVAGIQFKMGTMGAVLAAEMLTTPKVAFAGNASKAAKQGENAIWKIIEMVLNFTTILGIVFAFLGLWKLIQAFRNDNNPEAMASGAKDLMVGFLLIGLKVLGSSGLKTMLGF